MSLNFCAVDFETAMACRASAIQIGLAKVRNGEITETLHAYIRPAKGFETVHQRNYKAHRIPQRIVDQAPEWPSIFPMVRDFIGDDTLVSHNVQFDGDVMAETCASHGFPAPQWEYGDSMLWAKALLGKDHSSLSKAADLLSVPFKETHDALNDVIACAYITTALAAKAGFTSISDLATIAPMRTQFEINLKPDHQLTERQRRTNDYIEALIATRPSTPNSLEGKGILFTGDLSIDRDVAKQIAKEFGASPKPKCSPNVNIVVIGEQFFTTLRGHEVSSKVREAIAMAECGGDITFMTEDEFYAITGHEHLIKSCPASPALGGPVPFSSLADRIAALPY